MMRNSIALAHLSWALPASSLVLAMLVHGLDEPRAIPFFISEADAAGLQGWIFSIGLTLGGSAQMAYAWRLGRELEAQRPDWWKIGNGVGMVAGANAILLARYDMWNHLDPHVLTSMLAFGGGLAWALTAHLAMGDRGTVAGRRERRGGFLASATAFIVMIVAFRWGGSGVNPTGLTTAQFLNEAQAGINIAAPAEYVLVAGLFLCLASFRHELRSTTQGEGSEP